MTREVDGLVGESLGGAGGTAGGQEGLAGGAGPGSLSAAYSAAERAPGRSSSVAATSSARARHRDRVDPPAARRAGVGTYDAACEAIVWSLAVTVLGAWWWLGLPIGLAIWLAAWRWLRRAASALSETAEAAFILHSALLTQTSVSATPRVRG